MDIIELKKICQKDHYDDLHEAVVRKISIYFTKWIVNSNITANQLSLVSLILGFTASLIFLIPAGIHWFFIPAILVINAILDHTDGEVARYRGESSLTGLFVDRLYTVIVFPFILICAATRLCWDEGSMTPLIFGALGAWTAGLMRYLRANVAYSFSDAIRNPEKAKTSQHLLDRLKGETLNIEGLSSTRADDSLLKRLIYFATAFVSKGLILSLFLFLCIVLYLYQNEVFGLNGLYIYLIANLTVTTLANIYLIRAFILNRTPDRLFAEYLKNHE